MPLGCNSEDRNRVRTAACPAPYLQGRIASKWAAPRADVEPGADAKAADGILGCIDDTKFLRSAVGCSRAKRKRRQRGKKKKRKEKKF